MAEKHGFSLNWLKVNQLRSEICFSSKQSQPGPGWKCPSGARHQHVGPRDPTTARLGGEHLRELYLESSQPGSRQGWDFFLRFLEDVDCCWMSYFVDLTSIQGLLKLCCFTVKVLECLLQPMTFWWASAIQFPDSPTSRSPGHLSQWHDFGSHAGDGARQVSTQPRRQRRLRAGPWRSSDLRRLGFIASWGMWLVFKQNGWIDWKTKLKNWSLNLLFFSDAYISLTVFFLQTEEKAAWIISRSEVPATSFSSNPMCAVQRCWLLRGKQILPRHRNLGTGTS